MDGDADTAESSLTTIYVGRGWNDSLYYYDDGMFQGYTKLVGGAGTTYDENCTGKEMAKLDSGETAGYFSKHSLTMEATEGGSAEINGNPEDVFPGDTVTLTINADPGYTLSSLTVKEANDLSVTVTDHQFVMPASDTTVTAVFTEQKYTVIWKNGDEVLETDENLTYGTTPTYDHDEPVKEPDGQYTYSFIGWSPEITNVTGDAVYTAVFKASFDNTSVIDANEIVLGNPVVVTASAEGGQGECRYALDYKAASDTTWNRAVDLTAEDVFAFTPPAVGKYSLRLVAQDSNKVNAYAYTTLMVHDTVDLTNSMTVSASDITLGEAVTITGAASGGYGDYRFAVDYKTTADTNWQSGVALTRESTLNFTPAAAGAYTLRLTVRDAKGKNAYRYVKLMVHYTDELTNNMTISSTKGKVGDEFTITCAAAGGYGDYRYTVDCKDAEGAWQRTVDWTTDSEIIFTPYEAGTYHIRLIAQDASKKNAYAYVSVKVTAD